MKYVLSVILGWYSVLGFAEANPITVRTGAHEGFVRVVLDVPRGTVWSFNQVRDEAIVTVENHLSGFDTRRAFRRIDRSLVRDMLSEVDTLTVQLGCACDVEAYVAGDRMVVLDIAPSAQQLDLADIPFSDMVMGRRPLAFSTISDSASLFGRESSVRMSEEDTAPSTARSVSQIRDLAPVALPGVDAVTDQQNLDPSDASLAQAQRNISESLGLALTRGVLQPSGGRLGPLFVELEPTDNDPIFDSSTASQDTLNSVFLELEGNVRVTSSFDAPASRSDLGAFASTLDTQCIDGSRVALNDWADDRPFQQQVSSARAGLYSDRDRLNVDVAIKLARTYLFYGMGVEARQILQLDPELKEMHPELNDMAAIFEYGDITSGSFLSSFLGCNEDLALWALLATPKPSSSVAISVNDALLALSGLPLRLRQILAPKLSSRLQHYGDAAAASAALRTLERAPEPLTPKANLTKAELELSQGDTVAAVARLNEVVSSNAEQSAQALISLVNSHIASGASMDESLASLVEAYAMEMRDDPIGVELSRAHILAWAKSKQFRAAFEKRTELRLQPNQEAGLSSRLFELLADEAPDVEFLSLYFDYEDRTRDRLSTSARIAVAERLVSLGFLEQADQVLLDVPLNEQNDRFKLTRASIALSLRRPAEAEAHLFEVEGSEAQVLRGRARAMSGDYEEAFEVLQSAGQAEEANHAAWMAESWQSLLLENASEFGAVAGLANTSTATSLELEGMLGRAEQSITESANARAVLADLLDTVRPEN